MVQSTRNSISSLLVISALIRTERYVTCTQSEVTTEMGAGEISQARASNAICKQWKEIDAVIDTSK